MKADQNLTNLFADLQNKISGNKLEILSTIGSTNFGTNQSFNAIAILSGGAIYFQNPKMQLSDQQLTITGQCSLQGIEMPQIDLIIGEDTEGLSYQLKTSARHAVTVHLPKLDWFGIESLFVDLNVSSDLDTASATIDGVIKANEYEVPVTLSLPFGHDGWVVSTNFQNGNRPNLSALTSILSEVDIFEIVPSEIRSLFEDVELSDFEIESSDTPRVHVRINTDSNWEIIPKKVSISGIKLEIDILDPFDSQSKETSFCLTGLLNLGGSQIEVVLKKEDTTGNWSLELDTSYQILPSTEFAGILDGPDFGPFASSFGSLGDIFLNQLFVSVNTSEKTLNAFSCMLLSQHDFQLANQKNLSLHDVMLDLNIDFAHSEGNHITGKLLGKLNLGLEIDVSGIIDCINGQVTDQFIISGTSKDIQLSHILEGLGTQVGFPEIQLDEFSLSYQPKYSSYSLNGKTSSAYLIDLDFAQLDLGVRSFSLTKSEQGTLGTISGTTKLAGASFDFEFNIPGPLKISGTLPQTSFKSLITELCGDISPFKELFGDGFDLVLEQTAICIQKDDTRSTASFATRVAGFGTMILYVQSDPTAVVVAFDLPDEWKFSSLGLPKDLDGIQFTQSLLVISSLDDPSFQLPGLDLFESADLPETFQGIPGNQGIKKGLELHSNIALDQDMFDEIMHWLNLSEDLTLPVNIKIGVDPFSAELAAQISGGTPIEISGVKLTNPQLQMGVGMDAPYFGVGAVVEMELNGQNIQVQGNIDVEANGARIEAIFDGTLGWNEIFGIPASVSTTNPTVVFGFSFQGLPTLGLSSDFQIDQLAGALAISLNSMNPSQSMLSGTIEEIKLDELVSTFCESGAQTPNELVDILNQTSLSDVNLYIVPTNTTIGEDEYEAGFKFSGNLNVMGLTSSVNVELDPQRGIDLSANMDQPLAVGGVLTLSGDEGADGPSIAVCTYADDPKFALSGLAIVSGVFSVETDIIISNGTCSFMVDVDVFNYFHLHLDADNVKLSDLSTFNCDLSLQMNVDQINILISNVLNNIQLAASDAQSNAEEARRALDTANSALDSVYDSIVQGMNNEISHKQNLINSNTATISNYRRTRDKRYGHYVRYVRRNGYWTTTKNRWGWSVPKWVGPQYGTRWEIFVWIQTSITALQISNDSLNTDITNLRNNIRLVKTAGPFLAQASRDAINAASSTVSTATEAYNQATAAINQDLAKAASWITSNTGALLQIHNITIDTKLGNLLSSSFEARVDYTLAQQNRDNLSVQLDINQIGNFTSTVANKLIEELKKIF